MDTDYEFAKKVLLFVRITHERPSQFFRDKHWIKDMQFNGHTSIQTTASYT